MERRDYLAGSYAEYGPGTLDKRDLQENHRYRYNLEREKQRGPALKLAGQP